MHEVATVICNNCYNEFSWRDETCPTCGVQTAGPVCGLRIWIARWVSKLTSSPENAGPQFTLKRMFVGVTMMALGIGLFAFLIRPMAPAIHLVIQGSVGELLLFAGALVGAGAGSLCRRPIVGAAVGAIAGVFLTMFLYAIIAIWAFSQMRFKPPNYRSKNPSVAISTYAAR